VTLFSPRLPHLFPRATLARLVAPTYALGLGVDEEEAYGRLEAALAAPEVRDLLLGGLSAALEARQGPRTTSDQLLDRLSARLGKSRRVRAAKPTPATAAVLVRLNLELGLAPEPMRATLATGRGALALEEGLAELGRHLVKELLR